MRGVAYIDASVGFQTHLFEGEAQRRGMGLFLRSVTGADASGEGTREAEVAELTRDAAPVAAGDEAELIAASGPGENTAGTRDEPRCVMRVILGPEFVGELPLRTRNFGGAIDAMPVRGVVNGQFLQSPGDAEFPEHGEIGGRVGVE